MILSVFKVLPLQSQVRWLQRLKMQLHFHGRHLSRATRVLLIMLFNTIQQAKTLHRHRKSGAAQPRLQKHLRREKLT